MTSLVTKKKKGYKSFYHYLICIFMFLLYYSVVTENMHYVYVKYILLAFLAFLN